MDVVWLYRELKIHANTHWKISLVDSKLLGSGFDGAEKDPRIKVRVKLFI